MKDPKFDLIATTENFKGFLLLTEIEVDNEMRRRGLYLGPSCLFAGIDGSDFLDDNTCRPNDNSTEIVEKLIDFPKEFLPLEVGFFSYLIATFSLVDDKTQSDLDILLTRHVA